MKGNFIYVIIFFAIIAVIVLAVYNQGYRNHQITTWKLGTSVNITYNAHITRQERIEKDVLGILDYYEEKYSPYISSERNIVQAIREAVPGEIISLDHETEHIIRTALNVSRETYGAFDITIRPLLKLWGLSSNNRFAKPSPEEIEQALENVGYEYLEIENGSLVKTRPVSVDLGGIAKGFIIDRISDSLVKHGSGSFMINIGGDIYIHGNNINSRDGCWSIGLQDPFFQDEMMAILRICESFAITTSGNYERYIEINGQQYGHIIDPRTGYPVNNTHLSVTVLASNALLADTLSTAFFVLGPEKTKHVLSSYPEAQVLFIFYDNEGSLSYFHSPDLDIDFLDPYYVARETFDNDRGVIVGSLKSIDPVLQLQQTEGV